MCDLVWSFVILTCNKLRAISSAKYTGKVLNWLNSETRLLNLQETELYITHNILVRCDNVLCNDFHNTVLVLT